MSSPVIKALPREATTGLSNQHHPFIIETMFTSPSALSTIIKAGTIAGVLDALAGIVVYYIWFGFNPFQVLQFIASGAFGPSAMNGGWGMIAAGTGFHFLIAYVCAALYFLAAIRWHLLTDKAATFGLLYGIAIWLVMNLIVIPFSAIPPAPFDALLAIVGILWHMVLVGLPIAWITRNHYVDGTATVRG